MQPLVEAQHVLPAYSPRAPAAVTLSPAKRGYNGGRPVHFCDEIVRDIRTGNLSDSGKLG